MHDKPLKVFIGYDDRETIAFHVLSHSIMRHASGPVSITPLVQSQLREKGLYTRPMGKTESTQFSMTRFLVPYLCGYGDWAIFLDCDMLVTADIYDLIKIAKQDEKKNGPRCVWCVQHDYTPKTMIKFLGQQQTMYPRKNWSSVMVFRNKFCDKLTPSYVNEAAGKELHRMSWAGDDPRNIGHLPKEWNWLVGEYETNNEAKLYHWTIGGPWFRDYQFSDNAGLWFKELDLTFPTLNLPKPSELTEYAHL